MSTNNIKDQLKRDESEKLFPYKDSVGKITIGVGHNLTDDGIPQTISDALLNYDLQKVYGHLSTVPWMVKLQSTDNIRWNVLVNMCFNMGFGGLMSFKTFLGLMEQGKWNEAATDGRSTVWYKQVGARAERLMKQLETGEWV